VNRGPGRGRRAARLLGLPFVLLSGFRAEGYSLIVNATPVGREDASMPFAIDHVARDAVVVDLVYSPEPTTLVRAASGRGVTVVDGREVLMVQVRRQFAMMTGRSMPEVSAASKPGPRSFAAARGLCGG
jgi:3-dehydroquinate dehydratase / shikimate dehydrogenase